MGAPGGRFFMTIYVSASIISTAGSGSIERIVSHLEHIGHTVYQRTLSEHLPPVGNITSREIKEWYAQWVHYVSTADLVVVEGSYPSSIHVGFEMGAIAMRSKPIILLYRESRDPVFIHQLHYSRLIKSGYTKENLPEVLDWCLGELEHTMNRRFTFYVSPEIDEYLTTIVEQDDTSRSEYIRELIERDRKRRSRQ